MKKIICLILTFIITLSLTSCNSEKVYNGVDWGDSSKDIIKVEGCEPTQTGDNYISFSERKYLNYDVVPRYYLSDDKLERISLSIFLQADNKNKKPIISEFTTYNEAKNVWEYTESGYQKYEAAFEKYSEPCKKAVEYFIKASNDLAEIYGEPDWSGMDIFSDIHNMSQMNDVDVYTMHLLTFDEDNWLNSLKYSWKTEDKIIESQIMALDSGIVECSINFEPISEE